ncbi:MAG TPA: filamentous hemagglutinin family protein, partial [Geobacteraceae bacterium]
FTPGWDMVITGADGLLHWSASFQDQFMYVDLNDSYSGVTTQGVAAMGGGSIAIRSGGDVTGQFGTFGTGDLRIAAGGDLSGRFLVKEGVTVLNAGGNLAPIGAGGSLFDAFHDNIRVTAQGNISLGTVVNPTVTSGEFAADDTTNYGRLFWNLDWGYENSSLTLTGVNGDVDVLGSTRLYATGPTNILPPTLNVWAGGNITLPVFQITLAPSPTGTLRLEAGGDINGATTLANGTIQRAQIFQSDMDPSQVYGYHKDFSFGVLFDAADLYHAEKPVHTGDAANPNVLAAGGDITDLMLYFPKATSVRAGNDITDINMQWQNVSAADVSSIVAGHDIIFSSLAGSDNIIRMGGPGSLLFMAGDSIDLGTTKGIQMVGNTINPVLPDDKSAIYVAAGVSPDLTVDQVNAFFPELITVGAEYSKLLAAGDRSWHDKVKKFEDDWVTPLFANSKGSGDINMINSQISTTGDKSDIYIVSGGTINVGKSALNLNKSSAATQTQSTGIFTASGGTIGIFAKNDVNVNESKVMTFIGGDLRNMIGDTEWRDGDIVIWSDQGSINAGRGSKTAVSAQPPYRKANIENGRVISYTTEFTPPSVGSGIRAVTYDPDGPAGPKTAPPAGDIFAFAPQGVIDAGEAGIAGGRVILGATEVLNAKNISFSVGSVGVPSGTEAGVSLGSLAGAGTVSEASKMAEQATVGTATEKAVQQSNVVDSFLSKWLDVKVIGFDSDSEEIGGKEKTDEKEKKKQGH